MVSHPPIVGTLRALASCELCWHDESDTAHHAQALAAHPLLPMACIELAGELGAGKSTWVRYLLRALGVSGRIKSPTYAVVEPHQGQTTQGPLAIWHFDFYRFQDPREWEDAGFRDLFASPGLKLCEWAEQARAFLPTPDLRLHIQPQDDGRRQVLVQAFSARGQELLA
jgi:tRNA threonylcarbamoyladenosine biosynthesis protein TsaE